jgi:hypothetical protein
MRQESENQTFEDGRKSMQHGFARIWEQHDEYLAKIAKQGVIVAQLNAYLKFNSNTREATIYVEKKKNPQPLLK